MKNFFFLSVLISLTMTSFAQVRKGSPSPALTLADTSGQWVPMSRFAGKVLLVDFWASWCLPCRKNNPVLREIYRKYHDRGFEIYGISIDEDHSGWTSAIRQDQMEWIQVVDPKGWEAGSVQAYGVSAIPASFLIDRAGIVRSINPLHRELESAIRTLLKK